MCLRRLIEYEYSGDWTAPLSEPPMQSQGGLLHDTHPILTLPMRLRGIGPVTVSATTESFLRSSRIRPSACSKSRPDAIARHMIGD